MSAKSQLHSLFKQPHIDHHENLYMNQRGTGLQLAFACIGWCVSFYASYCGFLRDSWLFRVFFSSNCLFCTPRAVWTSQNCIPRRSFDYSFVKKMEATRLREAYISLEESASFTNSLIPWKYQSNASSVHEFTIVVVVAWSSQRGYTNQHHKHAHRYQELRRKFPPLLILLWR